MAVTCAVSVLSVPGAAYADGPADDPFYKPPSPLPAGKPGDIIRFQSWKAFSAPGISVGDVHSWRIMYRSTSATGRPIAVTGGLLIPKAAYKGPGKRPLIGLGPGTKGLGDHCAPTYGMSIGLDYEGATVRTYLDRGWAVAVTDYEGLGTPGDPTYMVGRVQGTALLDVMRAATRFPIFGMPKDSPMAAAGYSQGGAAAGWAAELAPTYAPELPIKAVSAGGVPADLDAVAKGLDGGPFFAFLGGAAVGLDSAYDDLELEPYLTDAGRKLMGDARNMCLADSIVAGAFKKMSDLVTTDLLNTPQWQARLKENRLGAKAPAMPVFMYHSVIDEIVPFPQGKTLRTEWCAKGANVDWREYYLGEHALGIYTPLGEVQNWLADRFAGKPVKGNCPG